MLPGIDTMYCVHACLCVAFLAGCTEINPKSVHGGFCSVVVTATRIRQPSQSGQLAVLLLPVKVEFVRPYTQTPLIGNPSMVQR
jgi:hypothetical protein